MKLTTNYTKPDWIRFSFTILLRLVMPFGITIYFITYLSLPILEISGDWMDVIVNNDKTIVLWRDALLEMGYSLDHIIVFLILLLSGAIVIMFGLPFLLMGKLMDLGTWLASKDQIIPRMGLVVFNNGKPIRFR